ncbi:hypothetical protein [Alcaligenes sp. SDU_A2]|uniref:hypothetical protein n=1 Tax=Alcaligenes sp. SDU_A2 TaxID=3136634 RepID=UPI00311E1D1E
MTIDELQAWMNTKIRNGDLSLDESRPFMAMTINIPAENNSKKTGVAKIDFLEKAQEGIKNARLKNDTTTLKMLEAAINLMQHHQGKTIGVDIRV